VLVVGCLVVVVAVTVEVWVFSKWGTYLGACSGLEIVCRICWELPYSVCVGLLRVEDCVAL